MAFSLLDNPFARINQNNGQVGIGGASHHITGILLMTRGVGHNKLTLVGIKEAVSDINSNTLFTFCGKAINEQSKIDITALGAMGDGFLLKAGDLIIKNTFGLVQ